MKQPNRWFAVDKEGLGSLVAEHGKGRLIAELVQNALDENATRIAITLALEPGRPLARLMVEDDAPDGFKNLTHAYTLFAHSRKKGDPEKRGRFNLGEKLVLAACKNASITTKIGAVSFDEGGQRREHARTKRGQGSLFSATLPMTREELEEATLYLQSLLLPEDVLVTLNGSRIVPRMPLHAFDAPLETVVADAEGALRRRMRTTRVEVQEVLASESAALFELGLPVVDTGDRWHVNVGQKVPLTLSRDNVPPAYLRTLRTLVLNQMHELLTSEDAQAPWVQQATCDRACSHDAMRRVLDLRFGAKRASFDLSDPEANKAVQAAGGVLVTGGMLRKEQWEKAKEAGAIMPAGRLMPTAKPYSLDPKARPVDVVPPGEWTPAMRRTADYARFLAERLMDRGINVTIVRTANAFSACYGGGQLDFNLQRLGHRWFEQGPGEEVDRLLIHEFGHEYSGDHLSSEYHDALCMLGARLKRLALEVGDELRAFSR